MGRVVLIPQMQGSHQIGQPSVSFLRPTGIDSASSPGGVLPIHSSRPGCLPLIVIYSPSMKNLICPRVCAASGLGPRPICLRGMGLHHCRRARFDLRASLRESLVLFVDCIVRQSAHEASRIPNYRGVARTEVRPLWAGRKKYRSAFNIPESGPVVLFKPGPFNAAIRGRFSVWDRSLLFSF